MNISQNGVKFIKSFEGLSLVAYKAVPTEKYWTIGYGHYGSDIKKGMRISESDAEKLLTHDLKSYVAAVNEGLKVKVSQEQFDALVSFTYNVGVNGFKKSTLLKKINNKQFSEVASEFKKWTKSGGVELKGLVTRRAKEAQLFGNNLPPLSPAPSKSTSSSTYQVRGGDTLTAIARKYNISLTSLLDMNTHITNPNHIFIGQTLNVPSSRQVYKVKKGDTLTSIASKHKTSVTKIMKDNPSIKDKNKIVVGQSLIID